LLSARLNVPEALRVYFGKEPIIRVWYDGLAAMTTLDRMKPMMGVSILRDGSVVYFVDPCDGAPNGIRVRHLSSEQVAAVLAFSLQVCDALEPDRPRSGCTDSPTTYLLCTGADAVRSMSLTCHGGGPHGAGFIPKALELVGLRRIYEPRAQACAAAAKDPIIISSHNWAEMMSDLP
jgi:hypothetical protein